MTVAGKSLGFGVGVLGLVGSLTVGVLFELAVTGFGVRKKHYFNRNRVANLALEQQATEQLLEV